jgi:hypothetical protein
LIRLAVTLRIYKIAMRITQYVLPVIVGAMSGMILITLGQKGIYIIYPAPANTDFYDSDSLAQYIKLLPLNAFILFLINYAICSFLAGIISTLVAKRESIRPPLVVGFVLTLSGLYYIFTMPQPGWYSLATMFAFMPFAYLGYLVARKKAVSTE